MKKKIMSVVMSIVMLFGCFGITGCQDNTVQLQAQIDALQAEFEQQAGKMQTLESEKEELNEMITQLETENKSLMDRVEKLEWSDQIQKGAFYSLQEAYEKEFLTREDLMHIAYFEYGKVEEMRGDAIVSVEFTPKTPKPTLDEKTEEYLKQAYYEKNKEMFSNEGYFSREAGMKCITIEQYFGIYNNCFLFSMEVRFLYGFTWVKDYWIDNVRFWDDEKNFIVAFHI